MSRKDRILKDNRSVYLPKASILAVITGSLCRFSVALAGAYGLCLMMNDSFGFTGSLDMAYVFTVCLICGLAAYTVAIARNVNRVFYLAASLSLTVFVAIAIQIIGIARFFVYAPLTAWNRAVTSVAKTGFSSLTYFLVGVEGTDPSAPGAATDIKIAFVAFCTIICFVFVHSAVRKARLLPPLIASAAVMTICFTYNMINENFAFLYLVSSAVGLLALKYCDSRTSLKSRQKKKGGEVDRFDLFKRASLSGLAGLVAASLVFAVGVYPAKTVTKPVQELKSLSSLIESMRKVLYHYVSGEALTPETYISLSTDRTSVRPVDRDFEDLRIFEVRSQADVPVYLRSWIGESYEKGAWTVARPLDSAGDTDYMPEDSASFFCRVLGINENNVSQSRLLDRSNVDYGFISSYISLGNLGFNTDMYYLPSRFSTFYGIMEYSADPSFINVIRNYSVKHNGMITLYRAHEPSYSTVAHLPYYLSDGFLPNMTEAAKEFGFTVRRLLTTVFASGAPDKVSKDQIEAIMEAASRNGVVLSPNNIVNSLIYMSADELAEFYDQLTFYTAEQANAYTRYISVPDGDSEYLLNDAKRAVGKLFGLYTEESRLNYCFTAHTEQSYDFDTLYRIIYKIAIYLADTAEYTLEPYGYKDSSSYVYQFLHTAKNGYCVQYATAAVMLLRSLGIPARYVEGFKTSEFERDGKGYKTVVLDKDSHAWVEVYVDGPGWMTFEVTEPMIGDMYGSGPSDPAPYTPDTGIVEPPDSSYVTTPVPYSHETETDDGADTVTKTETEAETTDGISGVGGPGRGEFRIPPQAIIAVAAVFTVFSIVFLCLYTRKKRLQKLTSDLLRASEGGAAEPYGETVKYCDYAFSVLSVLGYERADNELMSVFAARAGAELGIERETVEMADAAQKASFAGKADEQDCEKAAKCALLLQKIAGEKLTGFKKFRFVTVRKLV